MPYIGAFAASSIASTWEPGHPRWEVKGYQAAITQVFVGTGINWIGEFAPEIGKVVKRKTLINHGESLQKGKRLSLDLPKPTGEGCALVCPLLVGMISSMGAL